MTASKPSGYLQPDNQETAENSDRKQDIFHPDDPAIADSRLAALVENTHISSDLKIEKLAYINEMLTELKKLADSIDESMVSYLIDMALIETSSALQVNRFNIELKEPED